MFTGIGHPSLCGEVASGTQTTSMYFVDCPDCKALYRGKQQLEERRKLGELIVRLRKETGLENPAL